MKTIDDIPTPAVLLDVDALERNLQRMAGRCRELGVALRPHVKTHKCVEVAERQRRHGAQGLTASTLYEAQVLGDHGFDDVTWAFPVILNRIPDAAALARRITLRLVLDSHEALEALEAARHPFNVFLKVDSGYHRAGVDPMGPAAVDLAQRITDSKLLTFNGILSHSGQTYHGMSNETVPRIVEEDRRVMVACAERLRKAGVEVPVVSVGSTPGLWAAKHLEGVQEARPGNYVFYDYMQTVIGSARVSDCAVTVLASVVSSQPGTNHCVIDAGALSLSKDRGLDEYPRPTMGEIFDDYAEGTLRQDAHVVELSQEHGIVNQPLKVGSRVRILPNHSCLTCAQFDEYYVVQGEKVVDRWKIWRGRN